MRNELAVVAVATGAGIFVLGAVAASAVVMVFGVAWGLLGFTINK